MTASDQPTYEQLLEINRELLAQIAAMKQQIDELKGELEKLRNGPPKPPALRDLPHFVRPNKPKREPKDKKQRRQRDQGFGRPLSVFTRTQVHAIEKCPDCGRALTGESAHCSREVIDIPTVMVEVVKHLFLARWCGVCRKRRLPRQGEALSNVVVGQRRIGVRLMSLIAHLVHICRMPVRTIQQLLNSLFGFSISSGGIVQLLKAVAQRGKKMYAQLRDEVRSSPFVHADETGWREDGVNGYLWSFSTPDVRYFVREPGRGHDVPERELGPSYNGILSTDFYAGYNYHRGLHQRCWVHLLRDVHKLCDAYPLDKPLQKWSKHLHTLYTQAASSCWVRRSDRARAREMFQRNLLALARPYVDTAAPQAVLAKRLLKFKSELFTFVEHPQVAPDNNAAERAIRPAVIARKVSGGTRSKEGSDTLVILMSIFQTWKVRGLDPLEACVHMLCSPA